MKPGPMAFLVAELFLVGSGTVSADTGLKWEGSVGLGLRSTNDNAQDPSKLNEYRDLSSGAFGIFELKARGDNYYLNGFAENIGRDDWYFDLWGGKYDTFKYQLYGNALRHELSSGPGALTPYRGAGSATLTATLPNTNVGTWLPFDNAYDRQDVGGMFEISKGSPWYFRVDGNQVRRNGIKEISAAQGTSPGNGFVALASPVDFTTNNVAVEGGYQTKEKQFAVSFLYSKFSNDNPLLNFTNGYFAMLRPTNYDTSVLPPDNELWRIAANGTWRKLPLDSTLAGRLTYSKLTNDVAVLGAVLAPVPVSASNSSPNGIGTFAGTASSSPSFHGEIQNSTASLSLTSHPSREADTRVYWNWARKDNKSTQLTFSPTDTSLQCGTSPTCVPELFSYRKNNAGLEGSYRVDRANKLSAGYDYYYTSRQRVDFEETTDNKVYVEWKNTSLEELSARLKYQYLSRRSDYTGSTDPTVIDSYVRRFDLANVDQNLVKLVLDASPAPLVDLGFEAIYKKNDYNDTPLGRTDDKRQEYYASVGYGDVNRFRVMVFGDVEFLEYNSRYRVGTGDANPAAPPQPAPPANSTTYTWSAKNKDKAWQVGLGTDWVPAERWKVNASLIYAETNGSTDFATQAGTILALPLIPINNVDDTRRTAFVLKGTYKAAKNWEFTGGYAFEKYHYNDIGYNGFGYVVPGTTNATSSQTSYASGQNAFPDYTANIFYLISKYNF